MKKLISALLALAALVVPATAGAVTGDGSGFNPYVLSCGEQVTIAKGTIGAVTFHRNSAGQLTERSTYVNWTDDNGIAFVNRQVQPNGREKYTEVPDGTGTAPAPPFTILGGYTASVIATGPNAVSSQPAVHDLRVGSYAVRVKRNNC